jgi:DNA-binding HxlR family transcriptional regulator
VRMKKRAHRVWLHLLRIARQTDPPALRFRVSRRELQSAAGFGSLHTVDAALEDLEALGVLLRHPEPGSNEGAEYQLLTLEENPTRAIDVTQIAAALKQAAVYVEQEGANLTGVELGRFLELAHRARRLMSEGAGEKY